MLINEGEDLFLGKDGKVSDSPSEGATLLVAKGGRVDEAVAVRHKIKDRLTPDSEVELKARVTGDPYVLVNGRAVAKSLIEPPPTVEDEPAEVEAKHLPAPAETKQIPAPKKDGHKAADKA